RECGIGYFCPRVDSGKKSILPPAFDGHAATGGSVDNCPIARLDPGIQRSGIVDLSLLDLQAGILEIAMVVGPTAPQQEGGKAVVVVDPVRIIEKRSKSAGYRCHSAGAKPVHRLAEHRYGRLVLVFERFEMNQVSELLVPVIVVAVVNYRAYARHHL